MVLNSLRPALCRVPHCVLDKGRAAFQDRSMGLPETSAEPSGQLLRGMNNVYI